MKNLKLFVLSLAICALPFFGSAQNWLSVGSGFTWAGGVTDFYVDTTSDLLYIAGQLNWATDSNVISPGIYAWNGSSYLPIGCGIDWLCSQGVYHGPGPYVNTVTKYNNKIYVAGNFSSAGGKVCNNIARWDGVSWDSVGIGLNNDVFKLRVINGELYAVGSFTSAGGVPVNGIAKWNDTTWTDVHALPSYGGNLLYDVAEYNSELYVCGIFGGANGGITDIVRWDGSSWTDVGGGFYGGNSFAQTMCIFQNKLYVAGYFIKSENINNPGNFIAAWDGTTWSDPAGGTFNPYNPFDNGQIHSMTVYHNELYVAGAFKYAGGVPGCDIAKWDGTQWCTFDTINAFDSRPYALAVYHDSLFIGGGFWHIDGIPYNKIAKWGGGSYVDTCGQFYIGINDPAEPELAVSVYPNPATDLVTFEINGTTQLHTITVFDALGREVWRQEGEEEKVSLSTQDFAKGLYYYRIQTASYSKDGKLIIQ